MTLQVIFCRTGLLKITDKNISLMIFSVSFLRRIYLDWFIWS